MKLEKVGMLAVDSSRTRAYLDALDRNDLSLREVLLLEAKKPGGALPLSPYFDNQTRAKDKLARLGMLCRRLGTSKVNAPETLQAVQQSDVDVMIYSGPGGAIVGCELLHCGKKFLHVHPGIVPQYRGSTTVYYSLLKENICGASAIFLDEHIDCGPLLAVRTFPPPDDRTSIDYGYDPFIRANLLIRVLQDYVRTGEFSATPQTPSDQDDPKKEKKLIRDLNEIIAALPPLQRAIIEADRRCGGPADAKRLAEKHGTTVNVIHVSRHKGKKKIEQQLTQRGHFRPDNKPR